MKTRAIQAIKILTLAAAGVVGAASSAPAAPVQGAPAEAGPGYTRSRFRGVNVRHMPSPETPQTGAGGKAVAPSRGLVLRNRRRARRPQDGIVADVDPASFPSEVATVTPSGRVTIGHGAGRGAGHASALRSRGTQTAHMAHSRSAKKPASKGAAKR